eukprot:4066428-Pleurochrysis_carterae.AAC.4
MTGKPLCACAWSTLVKIARVSVAWTLIKGAAITSAAKSCFLEPTPAGKSGWPACCTGKCANPEGPVRTRVGHRSLRRDQLRVVLAGGRGGRSCGR